MTPPPPPAVRGAPTRGSADAPVTVIVFSDFRCPHCARLADTLDALLKERAARVRLAFRHLPSSRHPRAWLAAEAAVEVTRLGGDAAFWRYHDALFARQFDDGAFTTAGLAAMASEVGVDGAMVAAALASRRHRRVVAAEVRLADELALPAIPVVYVGCRRFVGEQSLGKLLAAVDAAATAPDNCNRD